MRSDDAEGLLADGSDEGAAAESALTIDAAVALAFGGAPLAPPSMLSGIFTLCGMPPYQRRVMLACGAIKAVITFGTYLPLFTAASYAPAEGCGAPASSWTPPARGSVAYEWRLCCGDEWRLAVVTSAYFVGCLAGAALGGPLADAAGRGRVVLWGALANFATLCGSGLAPSLGAYAAARAGAGVAYIATLTAAYTLGVEWLPEGWRSAVRARARARAKMGARRLRG